MADGSICPVLAGKFGSNHSVVRRTEIKEETERRPPLEAVKVSEPSNVVREDLRGRPGLAPLKQGWAGRAKGVQERQANHFPASLSQPLKEEDGSVRRDTAGVALAFKERGQYSCTKPHGFSKAHMLLENNRKPQAGRRGWRDLPNLIGDAGWAGGLAAGQVPDNLFHVSQGRQLIKAVSTRRRLGQQVMPRKLVRRLRNGCLHVAKVQATYPLLLLEIAGYSAVSAPEDVQGTEGLEHALRCRTKEAEPGKKGSGVFTTGSIVQLRTEVLHVLSLVDSQLPAHTLTPDAAGLETDRPGQARSAAILFSNRANLPDS